MKRNKILIHIFLITFSGNSFAQFGPIGFDFKDPYVAFNDLRFAVRLSTESNIYCPDEKNIKISRVSNNELILSCDALSSAGGQITNPGKIELKITNIGDSRFSVSAIASHPSELCKTILILIKGIEVKSFVSEYPQAKGVKEFTKNSGISVSYPSRSATMPLVFITTPEKERFVLSKDKQVRRNGFGCYYDNLCKGWYTFTT